MILFFDTETTGLPDRHLPHNHPDQPRLVQIAALLMEDDGTERDSLSAIIEPDGYSIPEGAAAVHGITTDIARRCGVPLTAALWPFLHMRAKASIVAAHNIKFDAEMIDIAMTRMPKRDYPAAPDAIYCTMEAAAPVVNLPPTERMRAAGIDGPKMPKLAEAYQHFFNEELTGAHDALVDVRACARIYFCLQGASI